MKEVFSIIKEQFQNRGIIWRIANYEDKATYQSHYLGLAWEYLYPLIQIGIYWIVFSQGFKKGADLDHVSYLMWMVIGITPWFFMNRAVLDGSKSVYQRVNMVSKMKFPVSVLPMIKIIGNLNSFWTMLGFSIVLGFFNGIFPNIFWFQWLYYFFAMMCFLFALGVFNSTVSVLVRDWQVLLQSIMRMLFYLSGVLFNFQSTGFPAPLVRMLELNPFWYIISGFRESMFHQSVFWGRPVLSLIFWGVTLLFLLVGSHLHYKFRARFVDLI